MMTPLQFEETYQHEWLELESLLAQAGGRKTGAPVLAAPLSGARLAALYRRACEHVALARARSYPAYIVDRLDRITTDAHQLIYRRRELGFASLNMFVARDFPCSVRTHLPYVLTS